MKPDDSTLSFAEVRIDTPRLLLRPLVETDAPALFALFSDPKVMRYWSATPWTSIDQAIELIAGDREALGNNEHLRLGLVPTTAPGPIGVCSLFSFHAQSRRAELGYALASRAWGQGFMHEALTALVELAFTGLDLNRLEADIDPRNLASARSLERLGFRREGHLRQRWIVAGEVSDTFLYGLLAEEWRARP